MELTDQDRAILREIQRDVSLSLSALAERLNMAQSTLWRRMNEMEKSGLIRGRVALVDPAKVGAKLCVLAQVTLEDHSEEGIREFTALIGRLPQVMECHKVSGAADYMLKIRAEDVEAYEDFQTHHLLRSPWVRSVMSSFVLKEVKATTEVAV